MLRCMNDDASRADAGTPMGSQDARRLIRRTDGKMIAGVAAGLGDYFGVDPVWFRLGFALTALLGGAGVVAYVILAAIMPRDSSASATAFERHAEQVARSLRGTPAWIGVALLVVGALLIAAQFGDWTPRVVWGVALIVLGIFLFQRREDRGTTIVAPPVPVPGEPGPAVPGDAAPPLPAAAPSPPPRIRERSGLGWMTIGVSMIVLGGAAVLDLSGALGLTLVQYLALALSVVGAGLLVGTWIGRARWLAVPGLLLIPFVLTASLIQVPFTGGFGEQVHRPATVAAVASPYHLVGGYMIIDLRDVPFAKTPLSVRATAVAGRILVRVPQGIRLVVRARAAAGQVALFGRTYDGIKVDVSRSFPGAKPDSPELRLDLETSFGQVEVLGHVDVNR